MDFHRNWTEYKAGFGDPSGEFWFGNENLHQLTKDGNYKLKIELVDQNGTVAVAEYGLFSVDDDSSNYKLTVGNYTSSYPPGICLESTMYLFFYSYTQHFRDVWSVPDNGL